MSADGREELMPGVIGLVVVVVALLVSGGR
jgi:hypothetical protein